MGACPRLAGKVTHSTITIMRQSSDAASITSPSSAHQVDDDLRARIDAAIGGSARYASTVMLQNEGRQEPIVVVLVDSGTLPTDHDLRVRFGLIPRESEVARLMGDRFNKFEIARHLGISIHTVRRHSERVLAKLAIHSRNDVRTALRDSNYVPALHYGQQGIA